MNKLITILVFVILALSLVGCDNLKQDPDELYYAWECDRKVPKNPGINMAERAEVCSLYKKPKK